MSKKLPKWFYKDIGFKWLDEDGDINVYLGEGNIGVSCGGNPECGDSLIKAVKYKGSWLLCPLMDPGEDTSKWREWF